MLVAGETPVGTCQRQQMVCVCFSKCCHLIFLMCWWPRTKAFLINWCRLQTACHLFLWLGCTNFSSQISCFCGMEFMLLLSRRRVALVLSEAAHRLQSVCARFPRRKPRLPYRAYTVLERHLKRIFSLNLTPPAQSIFQILLAKHNPDRIQIHCGN